MTAVQRAMLWELWRTSRADFLIRLACLLGGVVLLWSAPSVREMGAPEVQVTNGIFVFLIAMVSASSATCWMQLDRQNTGFRFRLGFTRPVSTLQLVAIPTIFTVAGSVACYVLAASMLNLLIGRSLPILGPSLLVASAVVCFIAACWTPKSLAGKLTAVTLLAVGMVGAVAADHAVRGGSVPIIMAIGRVDYFDFGLPVYVGVMMLSGLAFLITTVGVDRQRHGENWLLFGSGSQHGPASHALTTSTISPIRTVAFRSRFRAQCSYELQRFGRTVLLFACAIALAALFFVVAGAIMYPNAQVIPQVWLIALLISPPALQIIGLDGALGLRQKHGAVHFSAYDATRALTNEQLVSVKLLVVTISAFSGWLIICLVAVVHLLASGNWSRLVEIGTALGETLGGVTTMWLVAAVLCAVFLYISSSAILMVFGLWIPLHPRIFSGLALFFYANAILLVVDLSNKGAFHRLWTSYAWLVALAILVICTFALRKASLAGTLRSPLFLIALCLWVVYVATVLALLVKFLPEKSPASLIALGLATLLIPLSATAVAPLALAAHRNA